ncbi:RNA 2',3'-cyclic phosphodiesterase [Candidatus Azambacteria bacterium]|nr:RNA 2',3'-cyclic phosphodiesterase [Candidatus Azambacteria bacterium]
MGKRRLFLAVNLPEHAKTLIEKALARWRNLPIHWIAARNIHVTLVFIGYATDEEMLEIAKVARDVAARHKPFSFTLSRLILAPPGKAKRMVWWEGEASHELENLFRDLQDGLAAGELLPKMETRPYHPHITIGRIRIQEWRRLAEKPEIDEPLSATVPVDSFELMESDLKRGGTEYSILESFPLR